MRESQIDPNYFPLGVTEKYYESRRCLRANVFHQYNHRLTETFFKAMNPKNVADSLPQMQQKRDCRVFGHRLF